MCFWLELINNRHESQISKFPAIIFFEIIFSCTFKQLWNVSCGFCYWKLDVYYLVFTALNIDVTNGSFLCERGMAQLKQ